MATIIIIDRVGSSKKICINNPRVTRPRSVKINENCKASGKHNKF